MEQYRITEVGIKKITKKNISKVILLLLLAVAGGTLLSWKTSHQADLKVTLLSYLMIVIIGVPIIIYRNIKKQRKILESYKLTFTNNLVTREAFNTPIISIYFNEVKEIIKDKQGNFAIKGMDSRDLIMIFKEIENYAQLEATLNHIKPVTLQPNNELLKKYTGTIILILTIIAMYCVYVVNDKIIVGISGISLVALIVWSFYSTSRNKNVDIKTKKGVWVWLFFLLSIIMVTFIKLMK